MKPRQAATHQLTYAVNGLHREVKDYQDYQERQEARRELAAKVRGNRGGGRLAAIFVFVALMFGALIINLIK